MPIIFIIIGIVILALCYAFFFSSDTKSSNGTNEVKAEIETITEENVLGNTNLPTTSTPQTFVQKATYINPSRKEQEIEVTLTIQDDVVTDSSIKYDGKETGYVNKYQERFDEAYKEEIIGIRLDQIQLSRVGGASLTSEAFNDAVADIINRS